MTSIPKFAVLAFPSKANENKSLPELAQNIARRLGEKHPGSTTDIITSKNGDSAGAFRALAKNQPENYDKIYLMAHCTDGKNIHLSPSETANPQQLAAYLTKDGGLQKIGEAGQKGKPAKAKPQTIRLLACRTGRGENFGKPGFAKNASEKTYAAELAPALMQNIVGDKAPKNFYRRLTVKAPTGWSVTLKNGQNVSYFAGSKKTEQQADAAFEKTYGKFADKQRPPKELQPYLIDEQHKAQSVTVTASTDQRGKISQMLEQTY